MSSPPGDDSNNMDDGAEQDRPTFHLPTPLARTVIDAASLLTNQSSAGDGQASTSIQESFLRGISQVKVTQWGSALHDAKHVVFYFGGMPASAEEPALHSVAAMKDVYKERKIHLVCVDKPGFGGTSLPTGYYTKYSIQDDWPRLIDSVATHLNITSRYGVMGMSNGGPYVMACLSHSDPTIRNRVRAAANIVGVSDVSASGYFSWRHPSGVFEGMYNSMPVFLSGPLTAMGLSAMSFAMFRLGGFQSMFPQMAKNAPDSKDTLRQWIQDAQKNWGYGAAIDCQQGLSPMFARPNAPDADSAVAAYGRIDVPVGLWYGTKDGTVPMASAGWLHSILSDSTLHKVEAGHSLYFEHAEAVLDDLAKKMEQE